MGTRAYRMGLAMLAALAISVVPGLARRHGHGYGRGRHRVEAWRDHDHNRHRERYWRQSNRRYWNERSDREDDRDRDNRENSWYRRGFWRQSNRGYWNIGGNGWQFNRPPGWNRGRKRGWGNCDLPPGLAKKEGCYSPYYFGGQQQFIWIPIP